MTHNLAAAIFVHAQSTPDHAALVVAEQTYTYAQFATAASRVAGWISGLNRPGTPLTVGVLASRSSETYAGIVGAAWAGATYVPLDPKQPAARLASVIARAKLDALIVDARGANVLAELRDVVPANVLRPGDAKVANVAPLPLPVDVRADHPAYMIYTSGTTGVPKGVTVTAANVQHYLATTRAMFHINPTDRVSQFFETTFDVSIAEMFMCWQGGATLYVLPETKVMAPGGFIRQHEITVFHSVPSLIPMMQKLKQLEPGCFPSLRVSVFGGEGVPLASARAWQAAAPNSSFDNQYGPTEVAIGCIYQRVDSAAVETPSRGTLAIGRPFPGMHAAIVDADHHFVSPGQPGELALCGPQVAPGYVGDDNLTARQFVMLDHPTLGRTRWYLTGDSATIDTAGVIHCLGRIDNQVKVMGHRIELEEIEAHLRAVCATESVATIAWPIVNGNPTGIVAFISGGGFDSQDVREQLRRRMPAYMIPSRVLNIDTLPLSTNGKIDRRGLRALLDAKPAEGKVPA